MVTLAEREGGLTRALDALKKAKASPASLDHLKALGFLILNYEDPSDCCSAEHALQALPDTAKSVEYDGAKPSCALPSSTVAGEQETPKEKETPECEQSNEQLCRMACQPLQCKSGQCVMRKG